MLNRAGASDISSSFCTSSNTVQASNIPRQPLLLLPKEFILKMKKDNVTNIGSALDLEGKGSLERIGRRAPLCLVPLFP